MKWKINDETPNTSRMRAKNPTTPRNNHTENLPSPPWWWGIGRACRHGTAAWGRGISRRAAVCSSPSSWYPAFGLKLLAWSWEELRKRSVRLVEHEKTPLFPYFFSFFCRHSAANARLLPRRVRGAWENRTTKQNRTPLGHETTHRHTYSNGGACLALGSRRRCGW